ncbi:MAG TPA: hypothetical protein VFR23_26180 [Jiangellaceae bacterium]|nr:hypothetical protein [Jiangellaceae bacterium]
MAFSLIKEFTSFGSEIDLGADADFVALVSMFPKKQLKELKVVTAGSGVLNFRASGIDMAMAGLTDGELILVTGVTHIRTGTNVARLRVSWG